MPFSFLTMFGFSIHFGFMCDNNIPIELWKLEEPPELILIDRPQSELKIRGSPLPVSTISQPTTTAAGTSIDDRVFLGHVWNRSLIDNSVVRLKRRK